MRIGELARHTGVSESMLRSYELEGLPRPARTESGYRDYGEAKVRAAQRIQLLSASGLEIETIRVLLCMVDDQPAFEPCQEGRIALRKEVKKLRDLSESRQIVVSYLSGWMFASANRQEQGDPAKELAYMYRRETGHPSFPIVCRCFAHDALHYQGHELRVPLHASFSISCPGDVPAAGNSLDCSAVRLHRYRSGCLDHYRPSIPRPGYARPADRVGCAHAH
ncbi:MerR family transcriptional regulator [Paenalcaligenes niemegkensis]|uniref:MerR family transcriptional regulator n=1 Tax=Paenalcaligenes niemegkensis TaxID=2895469 RepID=UPI001EE8DE9E|nr:MULTISPECIES: MerR family transcriptional regulator [Alcaligenaceae]MCQ9617364.1 MerR family transcriptional regulator [Paenalcaligenes niemegkensis]